MTDQEQQRADHLALVAAVLMQVTRVRESDTLADVMINALDMAAVLQRAAEERVSNG